MLNILSLYAFLYLAILFLTRRTMIETPKEFLITPINPPEGDQKNIPPPKPVDPLAQDITEQFVKINGQKSQKVYKKLSLLGKGGFAECFLTQQKDTNRQAATKVIPKKLLDSHRTKIRLANEIKLHKSLRHENVVEFYNTFEDDHNVYINLEVCEHGSINDLLRGRFSFKPPQVQSFLYGICHGLKYLHSRGIIHRDLKLGNLFLDSDLQVKIGDFGLACKLQFAKEFKRTICGTPNYIAPQILEGKGYHFEIDIWSLGVILYTLFFTIPPFETDQPHTTYQKIRRCDYEFPKNHEVPLEAIDLIRKVLVQNPADRPTIDEILQSPFMKLGGTIPLGLPACCLKRAPTKRQIANWPRLLTVKQVQLKEMNSTMLGFFGISKKTEHTIGQKSQTIEACKQKQQVPIPIFCKTVEQSEQQTVVFYLNNGNFGIYDLANSEIYSSKIKENSEKQLEFIKKSSLNESRTAKEQSLNWTDCKHKVALNIKYKELLQEKIHIIYSDNIDRSVNVSKINIYKDVIMLRLTNRAIQIVYKEKDGFLLSPCRKSVLYFYSFKDMENGTEVDLSSALGATDKENKLNTSGQFSISSIFRQKKKCKHLLTMKKIAYLKGILGQTANKNGRKH